MKVSVITPLSESGNRFITETYKTLCFQTLRDFEWVVVENHGGKLPDFMKRDPRVRLFQMELEGIGALKRAATEVSKGDVIVELDHDDLLTPFALEKVLREVDAGADFVYSDCAEFNDQTWAPNVYGSVYGWSTYPIDYQGHKLLALNSPPLTPQNLRFVDWSPNHVRAWTRESYQVIGGHDVRMGVSDDHDLVVRYYLARRNFKHIAECLYLYRVHAKNNVKLQNAKIRQATNEVYNRSIWGLAERFADDNNLTKVDLCGGIDPHPGYEPYDLSLGHDLEKTWPIADNSVGVLRAQDALEHLSDRIFTMSEAYRVLAPGGFFMINVPSTDGRGADCDPTHKSRWNSLSFRYYTDARFQRYIPQFKGRFQVSRITDFFPDDWHRDNLVPYVGAQLIALKDGYTPMGEVLI